MYLFFELGAYNLYRYDLSPDTAATSSDTINLQLLFSLSHLEDQYWIYGLTTWQHRLYVNLYGDHENNVSNQMMVFTYDGTLVETMPLPHDIYDIVIHDGYLYANSATSDVIYKMDLSTFQILDTAPAPVQLWEGFDIQHGYLYYTDPGHYIIGRVPFLALFDQ